ATNLPLAEGLELRAPPAPRARAARRVARPRALMGGPDQAVLAIPPEVGRATLRNNQKGLLPRCPRTPPLLDKHILRDNREAGDGGRAIMGGNEGVLRARLADGKFFYDTDLKTRLEDRLPKFEHIVFHEKLGTQAERIARIERLATELAPAVGADVEKA